MTAARSDLMQTSGGEFVPADRRTVVARSVLSVLQNPTGIETLDWQIADAVLAASQPDREALACAFEAGALAVHREWVEASDRGEGPPRGDPEFREAASDYALSLLSGAGTKSDGGEERPASNPSSRVTHGPSDPPPGHEMNLSAPVGEPVPRGGAVADWWAESIKLYRQNKLLRKALLEQHDWHLAQGEKDFGEGITLNMADEYSDSGMCERTTAALDAVLPSGIEGYEKWKAQNTHPPAPAVGADVGRRVLDILNAVAPAVENLVGHQEQCDMDGVMVKVSRQALDEVLNAVNEVALVSALTRPLGGTQNEADNDCSNY